MPRGALPTVQLCWMAPVAASMATTRFWPLTAEYTVEPSAENTAAPTSACLAPSAGIVTDVGLARVPSAFTVNLRVAVGLAEPQLLAVGRVRRAFLADVVAA